MMQSVNHVLLPLSCMAIRHISAPSREIFRRIKSGTNRKYAEFAKLQTHPKHKI